MKIKTVSIAGFGLVGQRRYSYLRRLKNIKIVAVSDNFLPYRKKFKGGLTFSSYLEMIRNVKTDIVFVCLPNKFAINATFLALKNGSNVFCEKPPARNFKEMKKLKKNLFRFKKQILMYGFNHRYHDSILETKKIIFSKKLGKIINLRGVYGKSYLTPKIKGSNKKIKHFSWRERKNDAGGGILLDQGIHMVDMINYFCGNFYKAKSFVSNNFWKKNVEDNVYTILKNRNGIFATIHSSATLWKHNFSLDITLEKGMTNLSGILSGTKSYGKEKISIIKKLKNNKILKKNKKFIKDLSWEREIKYFLKIINRKKLINYPAGFKDAYDTMRVIDLIYKSK